jgi:NAD(P)-dependent dehydrogenase (short-subunit alcohol dehydrogenase family)
MADARSIVVFGGSSGLGAACVAKFAARGEGGVIADLKPPHDLALIEDYFAYQPTDVTSEEAVRAALALAQQRGPLRAVIVCAGILHAAKIAGREGPANLCDFRRVIEINLIGTFNVLRLAADAMKDNPPDGEGERGAIVLTSSVAAYEGQIGQAAYSAAKGGVASMTLPAARELGRHGIRVVAIAPGVFETPMMELASDEIRASLAEQVPFPPRFGRPEEFAALVDHVLENRMLNGVVLRLDGGLRMGPR